MPSFSVTLTYSSQMRRARSRDSSTFMPPNRTKGLSLAISISATRTIFCAMNYSSGFGALLQCRIDKAAEQRMAVTRGGGEFRVELAGNEPRMIRHLDHFHQGTIHGAAGNAQTGLLQLRQQVVVDFITVAVTLDDHILTVAFAGLAALDQRALLTTQTHGAAQIGAFVAGFLLAAGGLPFGDQADHRMLGGLVEFGGIGVLPAQHVAGKLDDRHLHAQADAQIGNVVFTGVAGGGNLAFHTTQAEAAWHQDGINVFQLAGAVLLDGFGVDIAQVDLGTALDAGVAHGLDQRLVGVQQLHVLADHGDGDFLLGIELGVYHTVPLGQIGAAAFQTEALDHIVVQALGVEDTGNAVDGVGIRQADHRTLFDVGEQGDLAAGSQIDRMIGAAHQYVRLQTDGAQFLDRVLGRLGLGFAGGGDEGHQSQVHEHGAAGAHFQAQLTDGLEEGLGLDVAHGAADLDHGHVGIAGATDDTGLDLVGDVRNHLDGSAQIVTTALLAQHVLVDATCGEVVVLGHAGADEALVVAQVQVGLGAVVGDEDLTVLERAHGAWIHVDIGVQLEHGDLEATCFENRREGCRGDALAQ